MRLGSWKLAAALAAIVACTTGGVAHADTITVNSTGDPTDGGCPDACSLRHAVAAAADGDTIALPGGATFALSQGAPIDVTHAVTITGAGPGKSVIDGSQNKDGNDQLNRIFTVNSGATLDLSGVTLSGGRAEADETCAFGCWTLAATGGGAVLNADGATTSLSRVTLTGNWARVGGAVASAGTLALSDVDFHGDDAAFGGGLFVRAGSVTAQRVAFHDLGPSAFGGGAAFVFGGGLTLRDSTVTGSGGVDTPGGAIENYGGALTLTSATLAGNRHGSLMTDQGAGAVTTAQNTIIAADADGDSGCTPVGRYTGSDTSSDRAITIDGGNNLDQDGQCLLTGAGDVSNVDPRLAPLADNGGPTPTRALLHGSPALDAANGEQCSLGDQRGVARPQGAACDIGAFEAVRLAAPTVSTEPATDVTTTSATLHATVDLAGEAGGARFELGTSADDLAPAGFAPGAHEVSLVATDLQPHTTYYFRAVAENATGASTPGTVLSFTTASGPPVISEATADSVDDTTAEIHFTLDPGGADTHYVVNYGEDDGYGQTTATVDVGAGTGPQAVTYTLTGLNPDTTYHFDVVAVSAVAPDGVHSGDGQFHTDRQITGTRGAPLTFTDGGDADGCPQAGIDWGDGSPAGAGTVTCTRGNEHGVHYDVTATHTYAQPGRYPILADYGRFGATRVWAVVSPPEQHSLSVTFGGSGAGSVSGPGLSCPGTCMGVYDTGAVVTLKATPAAGSRFAGWEQDCTGTGDCTVTLDQHRDVRARFALLPPAISDVRVDSTTDSTATLSFIADAGGADAHFVVVYGPTTSYGQSDAFDLQAAGGPRRVTRTLRGLAPASGYHFDVVATSAVAPGGVHGGDRTFTTAPRQVHAATPKPTATAAPSASPTPTAPAALVPEFRRTVVIRPLSGTVLMRAPGGRRFVPLAAANSVPLGTRIDATRGRVAVTALNRAGGTAQNMTAYGGMFTVKQSGAVTDLLLSGRAPRCSGKPASRGLWADGPGAFRIAGRYSSATGRGAKWQVADTCSATTTRVARGSALVTDRVRHKRLVVKAGHRYVARPRQ